jgi:hypothetical protein
VNEVLKMKIKIFLLVVINSILCFYIGLSYERNRINKAIIDIELNDFTNNESQSNISKQLEKNNEKKIILSHLLQLKAMMYDINNQHSLSALREKCYSIIVQDIIMLESYTDFDCKSHKSQFKTIAAEMDMHPCKLENYDLEKYKNSFIKRTLPKNYPFVHSNPSRNL